MEYEPPFESTTEIENLSLQIAESVGGLDASSNLGANPQLHRRLRIQTIHSSLAVEGNTLSEDQVTAILDGKRVLGDADDIREVQNAKRAYDLMEELDPFSEEDLLRIHGVMMDGLVADAGRFRSRNVGVYDGQKLIHAGTPAKYVPQVMGQLFDWMRCTDMHVLLASCIFHYEFEFIHPFEDGNGRTGRLWHTLLLSRWRSALQWLPMEGVIRNSQQEYYRAIAQSNEAGSCEAFVAYMLKVIRDAISPYAGKVDQAVLRERNVIELLEADPTLTVARIAEQTGMSQRTAERTFANLRKAGRLVRRGSARSGTWEVVRPTPIDRTTGKNT